VALLGGSRLAPTWSGVESRLRTRLRITAGIFYALLVLFGTVACLASGQPRAFALAVSVLLVLQVVALALAGLDRGQLVALANALVLVCLGALRGGSIAAIGVTGFVALIGSFLLFDHYARKLSSFAPRPASLLRPAALRAATTVLPVAICLHVTFTVAPATPYSPVHVEITDAEAWREEVSAAYRRVVLLGLAGCALVVGLARLVRRGSPDRAPRVEYLEAEAVSEEPLPEPPRRIPVAYSGARGRIVQLYIAVLQAAERRGLLRKPGHTPEELRRWLRAPADPLLTLTRLFEGARYGPAEPRPHEVDEARNAAAVVAAALRRRSRA
jgi:hypothetical protein